MSNTSEIGCFSIESTK
ncbi:hypothetical protein [Brevibacillus reuszeri]